MQEELNGQYFEIPKVSAKQLDKILSNGWRHFGTLFYYDKVNWYNGHFCQVIPLRIDLKKFELSKSLRKIIKKNKDVEVVTRPAFIDDEKHKIFHNHCKRFKHNVPDSIYNFLSENPATIPCETLEICLFDSGKLFAVSFMDIGDSSASSVYAMFELGYSEYSPGIYTLLLEIEQAKKMGKNYLYTGYAFKESSHYDYKKRFMGTEYFDWKGNWLDLTFLGEVVEKF